MTKEILWRPTETQIRASNIGRFMAKHGLETYEELIARSTSEIEWFWDAAMKDLGIEWYRPYEKILDSADGIPWTRWFIGGKTNIVHNCLDRHLPARSEQTALVWQGEEGALRTLSFGELNREVCRLANGLKALGLQKGDTLGLYMPFCPETVAALYAGLKLGLIVIPIFSGFASAPLAARLAHAGAKVLITADASLRRGKIRPIKPEADAAAADIPGLRHLVVVDHLGTEIPWDAKRDLRYSALIEGRPETCVTEPMDSEDEAMILYTSGTTGRPKGAVHTHAGCLAQIGKELGYHFDLQPDDRFFWLTDIGWMMGPWMIIGVHLFGGTAVMIEGAPDHPRPDRLWDLVRKIRITHFGISPTAVRMLMRAGDDWVKRHDLSSLRILGSTGEPWDAESYSWFFHKVGGGRIPIINISGGTEIIGCFLAPLPITPLKACTLRGPGLGMDVDVFDDEGRPVRGQRGHLVCKKPAPSMTRGFWKDPGRYLETYWSRWLNVWFHGDWAFIDPDGYWFLEGRSDDTIKVAGRRTGPAEIEEALIAHPAVSEAAAIGVPDPIKGEEVVGFVVLRPGYTPDEALREGLMEQVARALGKTLRPKEIRFVSDLPKTRSAKIIRRIIRAKYLGQADLGDLSSIENPSAIDEIAKAR
ncbi:MAG: AMP-binding protein [Nitrospirae bacterium]|nr:AMP-binding protein [Nitrospirota bacterium]